jgi:predicted GNAT family acetyltransferase
VDVGLGPGGDPVSSARRTADVGGIVRVGFVYTPPHLRRRGYASACVAAASEAILRGGAVACMLYADLANPTSNAIYQRLGYRPVSDAAEYRFDD